MKELITYTQLNIPYAAKDMLLAVLPMVITAIVLQVTFESQKDRKTRIIIWTKTILVTYFILVVLAAVQYAAYYDLYSAEIYQTPLLYAIFWIMDVIFHLFVVGATIYGAVRANTVSKNLIIFCSVLFSLFIGLTISVLVEVIYVILFPMVGEDGLLLRQELYHSSIMILCLTAILLLYMKWLKPRLVSMMTNSNLPLEKFIITPVVSIVSYSVLIKLLAGAGINLYDPKMTYLGITIYLAILIIFVILYKDLFLSMKISGDLAKTKAEIGVAETIQRNILPNIFPAYPERKEFDIYATMIPCLGVGGDFYDFFLIDEDHLAVVMADVSGKGIPAALFMMSARTLINTYTNSGLEPKDILFKVNNCLCQGNDTGMFVTVFLGILTISTGEFRYSNAGHNQPILSIKGEEFHFMQADVNLVMGAMEDIPYTQECIFLEKDSFLLLYTDGVTEALNEKEELYSEERLQTLLNQQKKEEKAQEIIEAVYRDICVFASTQSQADDITMLALRINGK